MPVDATAHPGEHGPVGVSAETLRAVQRAAGAIATHSVARMDAQLTWFRALPAEQRSWVTVVAQAGIRGYISWVADPSRGARVADEVFGAAPRDLIRAVSLRRTVELVRVAITVAEEELPTLASGPEETAALRESLLRYSREVAFGAAAVYAAAAETRGAWDARVEAAIIDGLVRGEDAQSLASRAAALNWDAAGPAQVLVGPAPETDRDSAAESVSAWGRAHGRATLAAVHGAMLVIVLGGLDAPDATVTELFGDGTVVRGPVGHGLTAASRSAADALSGFRVARAWTSAPPLVESAGLLPERVLAGDRHAVDLLVKEVYTPLRASTSPLLETLDAYLAHGGALEPAARSVFIHPNTMRYRLRRVADVTGLDPWAPRDRTALELALILGRLEDLADHRRD